VAGGQIIPPQAPRAHLTHIDTCYARPILLNWDADRDILKAARKLAHRAAGHSPPPTISETALGEAFLTIARDAKEDMIPHAVAIDASRRLIDSVGRDQIRLCGVGSHTGGDTILIAGKLREEDNRLSFTDSLVAATALACEDCATFYTNDPLLLLCLPLLREAKSKGMVVREAPR
jgi:hypothetical protein